MKRIMMMVALAAFMVAALSVSALSAFAISSEQQCEQAGGTFDRTQGRASCVYPPEPVEPKNERQADKFQKSTQTTETGQGNLDNKEDDTTTTQCGHPCPPGQFK